MGAGGPAYLFFRRLILARPTGSQVIGCDLDAILLGSADVSVSQPEQDGPIDGQVLILLGFTSVDTR
jgi:hypothetical protein